MKGYQISDKYTVQHNKVFETFSKVKAIGQDIPSPLLPPHPYHNTLTVGLQRPTKIVRAILSTTCYTSVLHCINFIYIRTNWINSGMELCSK